MIEPLVVAIGHPFIVAQIDESKPLMVTERLVGKLVQPRNGLWVHQRVIAKRDSEGSSK